MKKKPIISRSMNRFVLLSTLFLLSGCASQSIVKLTPVEESPGTYVLYKEERGGKFEEVSNLEAAAIEEANSFAGEQGKVAVLVSSHFTSMGHGPSHWASLEYKFRVTDETERVTAISSATEGTY